MTELDTRVKEGITDHKKAELERMKVFLERKVKQLENKYDFEGQIEWADEKREFPDNLISHKEPIYWKSFRNVSILKQHFKEILDRFNRAEFLNYKKLKLNIDSLTKDIFYQENFKLDPYISAVENAMSHNLTCFEDRDLTLPGFDFERSDKDKIGLFNSEVNLNSLKETLGKLEEFGSDVIKGTVDYYKEQLNTPGGI